MPETATDPVAELREAARLMREQHGPEHVRHAYWSAVADLLELEAKITATINQLCDLIPPEPGERTEAPPLNKAIRAVARAYLGRLDDQPEH